MNDIYRDKPLQGRQNASPVLPSPGCARAHAESLAKRNRDGRGENTRARRGRMSAVSGHSVFVTAADGRALAPTTPAKARKLLRAGVAEKTWSKFSGFGIVMKVETRKHAPQTVLGYDCGTKYEGFSVVAGAENVFNVKLDLPDKGKIVKKLEERRTLRRARRHRNCRHRQARFSNRSRKGFIAPSQMVVVQSRLKVLSELCRMYPVQVAGIEDVRFNHAKHRWGTNFSTVEIGKSRIRSFFFDNGIAVDEYQGYETGDLRKKYGYRKTRDKAADKFTAHCSDSLALACESGARAGVEPGPMAVVDDTYRCVRRKLHDTRPAKGGVRDLYSTGTVMGLRKGLLVGTKRCVGRLCGWSDGRFLYRKASNTRSAVTKPLWLSSGLFIRSSGFAAA